MRMAELPDFLWDLQSRWPFMFRLKGTVILRIWWQVLFVLVYTSAVVAIHSYVPLMRMCFPMSLVQVLGVVIGLLLVFRTNTAYDRYWEGRRLWSSMTQNIRTLTRCIWVGVRESGTSKEIVEKRSVINLLIAFAYATKNYLREEYSYDSDGIRELIKHIPKFCTPSSNQPLEHQQLIQEQQQADQQCNNQEIPSVTVTVPEEQGNEPSKTGVILLPGKLTAEEDKSKSASSSAKRRKSSTTPFRRQDARRRSSKAHSSFTAHDCVTPTNIPIELSYYIASYLGTVSVKGRDLTDPSTMLICNHALNNLVDCLTGFERILRTPIPLAYSVHLHHSIWLYLLALPYQMVKELGWFTVPTVVLSSFALLGILGIGWEIENPFGYDDNDLAPTSMENAVELSTKPVEEVRLKLAMGASRRLTSKESDK
ncbi:hypothetical protein Fcan01_14539 [Folsomia candida]|uniref:Uncharacterized protein n=1 Tax=Folsomia candida TaxID=158441 RepID=A0A226E353_FOLCA|nr:hypothetical protein Fcan01_14539 [Folsomia candida]